MHKTWIVIGACAAILLALGGGYWVMRSPVTPPYRAKASHGPDHQTQGSKVLPTTTREASIRLAVIAPETGMPAGTNSDIAAVVSFVTERINAEGGLLGRQVEVLVFDNGNTPLGSKRAAEKVVKSGADVVIGGWRSSNALAMGEVLQSAGIPMVAVAATNPDVTRLGDFIFRVNYTDSFQGAALARFARKNLKARTVVLAVNEGNAYSPFLADVFAEQFGQMGGEIARRLEYIPEAHDFTVLGKRIAQAGADLVFVPGYEEDSTQIVAESRRAGANSIFMGGDAWNEAAIGVGRGTIEGGYFAAAWHQRANFDGGLSEELSVWSERLGRPLSDVEVLALDAVYLVFDAIRRANNANPTDLRNALAATDGFKGISGSYRFDRNGDPEKSLVILRLKEGRVEHITDVRPERVPLAVIFAKTGDAAGVNVMGFEAARYAADEINLKGGVLGRRIELLEYDNQSTALGSRRAAEDAVKAGVSAVIGASWSSHSSAMAEVLQAAGVPMVSPASTNPGVTRGRDCVFRVCFNDYQQGEVMASFALNVLGARTAAVIINANNSYSVDLAEYFIKRFEKNGRVVAKVDYLQETNDFLPLLKDISPLAPDVVFVPGYHRDGAFIIRQARNLGLESVFLGGDGWDDMMYEYGAEDIIGSYFSEHWHVDIPDQRSRNFVERYAQRHKLYRTGLVALTYDTVYLLADAIRRADSIEPRAIRDALAKTNAFMGVTGAVTFDENGDPRKPVVILRFGEHSAVFEQVVNQ